MFHASNFAYGNIKNYICSQIAFTKEKIANCKYAEDLENDDFLEDRKEELETYKKILNLLTDNRKKLTARER
ncbi:MAG: hypothetical protein J6S67_01480 [Methanobrevibacter sp.]|nr:hypothetical protein [Methanobrevibacter sp.]